jgi:DNA-binding PadR family transcriptional regulator
MRGHDFKSLFSGRGRDSHFGGGHGHGGRRGFFDGFGGFGGMGRGGGMRSAKILSSEDLQLIILSLIDAKPSHGYEIIKSIEERSSGIYKPSPGMIYPALTYLEEASFAEAVTEGTKKNFKITKEGKAYLTENRERVDGVLERLSHYGERMAYFQEQMAQDEVTEEKWGGSPKDQQKKEWRSLRSEFHELRHELKMAIFEKINAPMEEKKRILGVLKTAIKEIRQG